MTFRSGFQGSIVVAGNTYRVLRYALHEQLSGVSSLQCSLERDVQDPPDPATLIDQPAVFTLTNEDASEKRTFVGSVVRARGTEELVELSIEPKAWRMSRRADCRIFQQLSAVDIVKKVLEGAGVDKTEWKTTGTYAVRDYTVQYRETDLAFVLRLLSEEGIYFAIQHDDQADTVVFGDDPKGFGPVDGPASLSYRATLGDAAAGVQAFVTDVARVQQVRSDKTCLRDYDPDKPKLKLESTAKTGKAEAEVYVWPGRFTDPKVGDRLAQVLLDSLRADGDLVTGRDDGALAGAGRALLHRGPSLCAAQPGVPGGRRRSRRAGRARLRRGARGARRRVLGGVPLPRHPHRDGRLPAAAPGPRALRRRGADRHHHRPRRPGDLHAEGRAREGAVPLGPPGHERRQVQLLDAHQPAPDRRLDAAAAHEMGGRRPLPGRGRRSSVRHGAHVQRGHAASLQAPRPQGQELDPDRHHARAAEAPTRFG